MKGVEIMPIENFSTQYILGLNLKESLDTIQKIGESAAKEYQIEQGKKYVSIVEMIIKFHFAALDKMEREWENMNLNIHPYRETGTGVIKGVDDINVILDEQITMTQALRNNTFIHCPYSK